MLYVIPTMPSEAWTMLQVFSVESASLTPLGVHGVDGRDQQGGVSLRVLHKHQQQLQGCLHHQAELRQGSKQRRINLSSQPWVWIINIPT